VKFKHTKTGASVKKPINKSDPLNGTVMTFLKETRQGGKTASGDLDELETQGRKREGVSRGGKGLKKGLFEEKKQIPRRRHSETSGDKSGRQVPTMGGRGLGVIKVSEILQEGGGSAPKKILRSAYK